jgi:hypothetical protein
MPSPSTFKRSGTKSTFGAPPPRPARSNPVRNLPSYADQDREKKEKDEDKEKKDNDKKDDEIDSKEGKEDEKKTKDVQATKPTGKVSVKGNVASSRVRVEDSPKVGNAYSRLWSEVSQYTLHPIKFGSNAHFIPNGIPLQRLLEIAIPLVARTNWITKNEVTFNPYAVATGYLYLYYIQILRAKKAASDLVGQESSALTRFEKYHHFEEIPIPEFLVPYYESIVATQMEDMKYSWIIPTWGFEDANNAQWPAYAGYNDMTTVTYADFIRPNIPFMLSNLATFGAEEMSTDIFRHMDQDRVFSPINLDDGAVPPVRRAAARFMNGNHNLGNAAGHTMTDVLNTCGASMPFQFWDDNYMDARRHMSDSNFYVRGGINVALSTTTDLAAGAAYTNPITGNAMVQTTALTSIDKYLFVAKENNPIWFEYILDQMVVFARHFPNNQKSLADIATTGGLESTIVTQLKFHEPIAAGPPPVHLYADYHCQKNNNTLKFYPKLLRDLTASFVTTRNDLERGEVLQGISIGINANPPVVQANNVEKIRDGKFFAQRLDDNNVIQQYLGSMSNNFKGEIPMYVNWTNYVRDGFVTKPE